MTEEEVWRALKVMLTLTNSICMLGTVVEQYDRECLRILQRGKLNKKLELCATTLKFEKIINVQERGDE